MKSHKKELLQVLDYYDKPSTTTSDNNKPQHQREFVKKIAAYLNLNENVSFELLRDCLKTKLRSLEQHGVATKSIKYDSTLLDQVANHYHEERIATLDLLNALLRSRQDPGNIYHNCAKSFFEELFKDPTQFVDHILAKLVAGASKKVPSHIEIDSKKATVWSKASYNIFIFILIINF